MTAPCDMKMPCLPVTLSLKRIFSVPPLCSLCPLWFKVLSDLARTSHRMPLAVTRQKPLDPVQCFIHFFQMR